MIVTIVTLLVIAALGALIVWPRKVVMCKRCKACSVHVQPPIAHPYRDAPIVPPVAIRSITMHPIDAIEQRAREAGLKLASGEWDAETYHREINALRQAKSATELLFKENHS